MLDGGEQPPGEMPPSEAMEAFYWSDRFGVPPAASLEALDDMPAVIAIWLPKIAGVVDERTGGRARH